MDSLIAEDTFFLKKKLSITTVLTHIPFFLSDEIFQQQQKVMNLHNNSGSVAVLIAAVLSGIVHLGLGVLGTFVLKRFPTSFSVGFLLGVLVVLANQNLLVFLSFVSFGEGVGQTSNFFAMIGFFVFIVMTVMALLLFHFKREVVVLANGDNKDDASRGNP